MNPPARASSRFRLYGLGALVAFVGLAWACDGYDSHIYSGELFEQQQNCLDQVSSVDVVDGVTPTAPCTPICLILPTYDGDGGSEAFVSTMCPPLPPAANTTQLDPRCPPALQAYNTDNFCLDGGGSTNPPGSTLPFADAAPAPADAAAAQPAPLDAGAAQDAALDADAN
jgi:hypothetical protein